ncbi:uncharacterized protein BDR25DRAFT_358184 [Lindgomyces ingoldianus]|uniref:Uncharacterized protein n=1 Tax=Lindgomyces ingoldianus TaxID=673940 RepID=A0ACB6QLS3_9PLEO|nr:uncharacterized protein BDR25DRAFT_358184 [Lindgomyces ingoldianus]KAF2467934.1 hypothetical protein BDR25DRAFT_358184 [Lindgomyces ingoldianus]
MRLVADVVGNGAGQWRGMASWKYVLCSAIFVRIRGSMVKRSRLSSRISSSLSSHTSWGLALNAILMMPFTFSFLLVRQVSCSQSGICCNEIDVEMNYRCANRLRHIFCTLCMRSQFRISKNDATPKSSIFAFLLRSAQLSSDNFQLRRLWRSQIVRQPMSASYSTKNPDTSFALALLSSYNLEIGYAEVVKRLTAEVFKKGYPSGHWAIGFATNILADPPFTITHIHDPNPRTRKVTMLKCLPFLKGFKKAKFPAGIIIAIVIALLVIGAIGFGISLLVSRRRLKKKAEKEEREKQIKGVEMGQVEGSVGGVQGKQMEGVIKVVGVGDEVEE